MQQGQKVRSERPLFFLSSRQLATKMTNPLIGLCFCVRPLDKTLYSPKRAARGEKKDGQPIEESEILLAKTLQKTGEPSLFCALCRTFGPYFLVSSLYKIIHDILMFVGPEILRYEYTASESSISFFHVGSFPSVLSSEAVVLCRGKCKCALCLFTVMWLEITLTLWRGHSVKTTAVALKRAPVKS